MTEVAAALGKIPSGIFVLTVRHGERQTGMLASWVMQCGFEPPMFTVAVANQRYLGDWLKEGARVCLNILSDDEKDMVIHFGHGFKLDEDAFTGLELVSAGEGYPPILADALGYLSGRAVGHLPASDHIVFSVVVEGGKLLREGAPMIHVRKNGLHY